MTFIRGLQSDRIHSEATISSTPRSVSYPKPHPNVDLNVDLGGWIANAKILVPVSELIKILTERDKLMKAIDVPSEKETVKSNPKEHEENKIKKTKERMFPLFYIVGT